MEDFNSLWIISRLVVYNEWKDIVKTLEEYFQVKISIHMADKASICLPRVGRFYRDLVNGRVLGPSIFLLKNGISLYMAGRKLFEVIHQ